MTLYLPDTHAIGWYESRHPKLSAAARQAFVDAEQGRALLIGHPVVLAEMFWMLRKLGRVAEYLPYVRYVRSSPIYRFDAITHDDLLRVPDFDDVSEMHDRLIVIAADRLGATLITNDQNIRAAGRVACLW